MQIVMEINEKDFDDIKNGETKASALNYSTFNAIRNGTPLPKGHGRLIDADKLPIDIEWDDIENSPTIIESDRSKE